LTFSLHISAVFAVRFVLGFFEAVIGPTLLSSECFPNGVQQS
jgi:hypothetical protein